MGEKGTLNAKREFAGKMCGVKWGRFFEKEILKPEEAFYLSYCWTKVRMPVHNQTALDVRWETFGTVSSATVISSFKPSGMYASLNSPRILLS